MLNAEYGTLINWNYYEHSTGDLPSDAVHTGLVAVVISGMQLLRLRSAWHRQQPRQKAILSHVDCFREC